jgi:hypothetical protein
MKTDLIVMEKLYHDTPLTGLSSEEAEGESNKFCAENGWTYPELLMALDSHWNCNEHEGHKSS